MTLFDYLKQNNLGTDRVSRMKLAQDLGMTDYVYGDANGNMEMLRRLRAQAVPKTVVAVEKQPASFVKVASPETSIYPVDWDKRTPLHGVTYVDPNKTDKSGYDFTADNTNWKTTAAKLMREHPEDIQYIKEVLWLLADEGAYDNQLHDLSEAELAGLQRRMKVLGKYTGPIDGKVSDEVIQAYRDMQVDGKYGTRTETALLQPDKLKVAPVRVDNTYSYASYLAGNPGHSISGGVYPVIVKLESITAPDEVAYPALVSGNWVESISQDLGGGDVRGWNLIDPDTNKSIHYAKGATKKLQIIAETKKQQTKDKKESNKPKVATDEQVLNWFVQKGLL